MGINVTRATSQANSITCHASDLICIRKEIIENRIILNQAWISPEMLNVNQFITDLLADLIITATNLQSLAGDIISVANEIKQEEEEAARRAAERAAREAARREAARQALSNSQFN